MSGRFTHQAGGAFVGLITGEAFMLAGHWDLREAVALAVVSTATAGGVLSPDVDQFGLWRLADKWIPDEWLGGGGPLQHRNLTHWVGWPILLALWWHQALTAGGHAAQAPWLGYGVAAGWTSHLMLDWLYGLPVRSREGGGIVVRGGIPLLPWGWHVGGYWRSSGIGSATAGLLLTAGTVAELNHLGVTYQVQIGLLAIAVAASVLSWLFMPAHR